MDKKKMIYIIGGIAVIGIGYYLYNKSKKKSTELGGDGSSEAGADTKGADTKGADAGADAGATTPEGSTPKAGQSIKDFKGKEKRGFRKDARTTCREKYGRGKNFNQCMKRVKGGGVAFDGGYDDEQYYSNIDNDFDIF
jgi:hypothetical protein